MDKCKRMFILKQIFNQWVELKFIGTSRFLQVYCFFNEYVCIILQEIANILLMLTMNIIK